jgi:hypothetical protein
MKKLLLPAILIAFIAMSFVRFPKDHDCLAWDAAVKLKWEDFQGTPDADSTLQKTKTNGDLSYDYKLQKEVIHVTIVACFHRNKSWVVSAKNARTPALLKHEQLHFDMTELMARKVRKDISGRVSKDIPGTQAFIDKANDTYKAELDSLSQLYDEETNYGTTDSKQKKWETKIAGELKKLETFSNTKVEIHRRKDLKM